jgi:hypothetical protein
MSDKKLKLSHKIAGVIDRLIKTTRVKTINLSVLKGIGDLPVSINFSIKRVSPYISYNPSYLEFQIHPELIEIVGTLKNNKTMSVSLEDLKTAVKDEPLAVYHSNSVLKVNTYFAATKVDFFEEFKVARKLKYKTKIKDISSHFAVPKINNLESFKFPMIKENLYYIKKQKIIQKTVQLTYLTEKQQLNYWRRAVISTKKEPKKLEFIGVYYQVPYYDIEKIKINYKLKELSYVLKENIIAKKTRICNIIVFRDIAEKKGVIIEE